MIVIWLYGTTAGLELLTIGEPPVAIPKDVALPRDIVLDKGEIWVIRKSRFSNHQALWVGVMRPAFEITYERRGSFYGAGMWLFDCRVDTAQIESILSRLSDQIRDVAQRNGRFYCRLADADAKSFFTPHDAKALLETRQDVVGTGLSAGSSRTAFLADIGEVANAVAWALDDPMAAEFGTIILGSRDIYPSSPANVAQFANLSTAIIASLRKAYRALQEQKEAEKANSAVEISQLYSRYEKLRMEHAEEITAYQAQKRQREAEKASSAAEIAHLHRNLETLQQAYQQKESDSSRNAAAIARLQRDALQKERGGKRLDKASRAWTKIDRPRLGVARLVQYSLAIVTVIVVSYFWLIEPPPAQPMAASSDIPKLPAQPSPDSSSQPLETSRLKSGNATGTIDLKPGIDAEVSGDVLAKIDAEIMRTQRVILSDLIQNHANRQKCTELSDKGFCWIKADDDLFSKIISEQNEQIDKLLKKPGYIIYTIPLISEYVLSYENKFINSGDKIILSFSPNCQVITMNAKKNSECPSINLPQISSNKKILPVPPIKVQGAQVVLKGEQGRKLPVLFNDFMLISISKQYLEKYLWLRSQLEIYGQADLDKYRDIINSRKEIIVQ